jgi:hypothetical protein
MAAPLLNPCQGYAPPGTVAVKVTDNNYNSSVADVHSTFASISYILFSASTNDVFSNGNVTRLQVTSGGNGDYILYVPYADALGNYDYVIVSINYMDGSETEYSNALQIFQPPSPQQPLYLFRTSSTTGTLVISSTQPTNVTSYNVVLQYVDQYSDLQIEVQNDLNAVQSDDYPQYKYVSVVLPPNVQVSCALQSVIDYTSNAVDYKSVSELSNTFVFPTDITIPPPTNFDVTNAQINNGFTLTWDMPIDDIFQLTGYNLKYNASTDPSNIIVVPISDIHTTSYNLFNLNLDYPYGTYFTFTLQSVAYGSGLESVPAGPIDGLLIGAASPPLDPTAIGLSGQIRYSFTTPEDLAGGVGYRFVVDVKSAGYLVKKEYIPFNNATERYTVLIDMSGEPLLIYNLTSYLETSFVPPDSPETPPVYIPGAVSENQNAQLLPLPIVPQNFQVANNPDNAGFDLSWDPITSDPPTTGYYLYYSIDDVSANPIPIPGGATSSYQLYDQSDIGSVYTFWLESYIVEFNTTVVSDPTPQVQADLYKNASEPLNPIAHGLSHEITFAFDTPSDLGGGVGNKFVVNVINTNAEEVAKVVDVPFTGLPKYQITIDMSGQPLDEYSVYAYLVTTFVSDITPLVSIKGLASPAQNIQLLPDPPTPQNFKVLNNSAEVGFDISWDPVTSDPDLEPFFGYYLYYTIGTDPSVNEIRIDGGQNSSCTLYQQNTHIGSTYSFWLTSYETQPPSIIQSEATSIIQAILYAGASQPLLPLARGTATTIVYSFSPPDQLNNGTGEYFQINVTDLSGNYVTEATEPYVVGKDRYNVIVNMSGKDFGIYEVTSYLETSYLLPNTGITIQLPGALSQPVPAVTSQPPIIYDASLNAAQDQLTFKVNSNNSDGNIGSVFQPVFYIYAGNNYVIQYQDQLVGANIIPNESGSTEGSKTWEIVVTADMATNPFPPFNPVAPAGATFEAYVILSSNSTGLGKRASHNYFVIDPLN